MHEGREWLQTQRTLDRTAAAHGPRWHNSRRMQNRVGIVRIWRCVYILMILNIEMGILRFRSTFISVITDTSFFFSLKSCHFYTSRRTTNSMRLLNEAIFSKQRSRRLTILTRLCFWQSPHSGFHCCYADYVSMIECISLWCTVQFV